MARTRAGDCYDHITLKIIDSAPCQLEPEDLPNSDFTPGQTWESYHLYYRGFKPHKDEWTLNWYASEALRDAATAPNAGTQIPAAQLALLTGQALTIQDTISGSATPEPGKPIPGPGQSRTGVRIVHLIGTIPGVKPDGTAIGEDGTTYFGKLWLH